jgi:hypothetical protein
LIAQEVEKVFPDMVSVDKDGFKRVNYGGLPFLMLQAIRELKAENDSLREQLKAEEERIGDLRSAKPGSERRTLRTGAASGGSRTPGSEAENEQRGDPRAGSIRRTEVEQDKLRPSQLPSETSGPRD